jgi:hypothetical protein
MENLAAGTSNSTSYTATLGGTPGTNPNVTVSMTGSSALVMITAQANVNGNNLAYVALTVSGASTVAPSDQVALVGNSAGASTAVRYVTGLTPGSNTFSLAYRVSGGNGTFAVRNIVVIPMP